MICDAVVPSRDVVGRCPECGALASFLVTTTQPLRRARSLGVKIATAWAFGPEGAVHGHFK